MDGLYMKENLKKRDNYNLNERIYNNIVENDYSKYIHKYSYNKRTIKLRNCNLILICCILFNLLKLTILNETNIINSEYSYIILKINNSGISNLLSERYSHILPDEILINGENQTELKKSYKLKGKENTIKLIWKRKLNSTLNMFLGCKNITDFDLSHFDTSKVTNMKAMFSQCTITSLDLSSLDTSNVQILTQMFDDCPKIQSLSLSNFKTSQLTNLDYMFFHCYSLTSLDLSNFDTSKLTQINSLLSGCNCLKYLNLDNLIIRNDSYYNDLISGTSDSLIIISNDNKWNRTLKNSLKIICINNDNFQFNSKTCYMKNEIGQSNKKLLCDSCNNDKTNNNFLMKYEDFISNNSLINCHNSIEGYYLDKNDLFYKKCYSTCKNCNNLGNDDQHNCTECNKGFKYIMINNTNYKNCYEKCPFYFFVDILTNNFYCTLNETCPENYNKLIVNKSQCINDCSLDEVYKYEYNNKCYKEPKIATSFVSEISLTTEINKIKETENYELNSDYEKIENTLIPEKNASIDDCIKLGLYEFNKSCFKECPEGTMISKFKKYSCDKICPKIYYMKI